MLVLDSVDVGDASDLVERTVVALRSEDKSASATVASKCKNSTKVLMQNIYRLVCNCNNTYTDCATIPEIFAEVVATDSSNVTGDVWVFVDKADVNSAA